MNSNIRKILFLGVCIPLRFILSYLSYILAESGKEILGILFGIIGITFLVLYFLNMRLTAPEGGGVTWWKHFRLIHGMLYFTGFIYSVIDVEYMWLPIFIDTLFGLSLFVLYKK